MILKPEQPEYYNEHVWDYLAACGKLPDKSLREWRMFLGLDPCDSSADKIIIHEYRRSVAHRTHMSLNRIYEVLTGNRHFPVG